MLELSWLRQEIAQRIPAQELQDRRWLRGEMPYSLRRRELLKLGIASSTIVPLSSQAISAATLAVEGHGNTVSIFSSAGRRWTIDPDRFDGNAKVGWSKTHNSFAISLADATLPGTGLRCDFTLTARLERGSWYGKFEFLNWGGDSVVSLDDWLSGSISAMAKVQLPPSDGGSDGFFSHFEGAAALQFSSEWSFSFEGEHIADLVADGKSASCSTITVTLPSSETRHLINEPTSRRSRIAFSGPHLASLRPEVGDLCLTCAADTELQAEYVRARDNRIIVASLWSADSVDAGLNVRADGVSGDGIQFPLDSYRLVQLHDGDQSNRALFAGVRPGERWNDVDGASVAVIAQANAVISAREHRGKSDECKYEASNMYASRFVIPFVGADSACFIKREKPGEKLDEAVEFKQRFSFFRGELINLDDYALRVARTTDGFGAIFRFKNINLQSRFGHWCLTRKQCEADSVLEFELPSQHLNEEALFSASPPGLSKLSNEVMCGPFDGPQARFLAYIGKQAFVAWSATNQPDEEKMRKAMRVLLFEFVRSLRTEENKIPDTVRPNFLDHVIEEMPNPLNPSNSYIVPYSFAKYLSQEYAHLLVKVTEELDKKPENPEIRKTIQSAADKEFLPFKFSGWRPRAIDSNPTRLLFRAIFDDGAEIPCHLDALMAWSNNDDKFLRKGLRFEEMLSRRAVAADTPLAEQKELGKYNGDRIYGLHEDPLPSASGQQSAQVASVDRSTGLELPYRLRISPVPRSFAGSIANKPLWQAVNAPRSVWGTTVPLWHLRAGRSGGAPLPMRALHSPDFDTNKFFDPPPPQVPPKMRTSLDAHDRHNLVALSGGFGKEALAGSESVVVESEKKSDGIFVPQPFYARQLVLTPLGASFDMLGTWDPPGTENGALTISKWDHRARIRRDAEVTVEYRGYLVPLGIRAVLIKRTTREFKRDGTGNKESYRAVLIQRYSIRVDQNVKEYPAPFHPYEARDWCFRNIRVTPHETPPLLPPENLNDSQIGNFGRQAFWPMIPPNPQARNCATGKLFEFTIEDGGKSFKAPLVFVDNQVVHTPSKLSAVLCSYEKHVQLRKWEMATTPNEDFAVNKAVARMIKGDIEFLPGASSRDSRHVTKFFVLGFLLPAQPISPKDGDDGDPTQAAIVAAEHGDRLKFDKDRERLRQPPFYPRVSQALIESQLLAQLSGNAVERNNIAYHPTFVTDGFHDEYNKGGVFARFIQRAARLSFGGNTASSGGAMSPTTMIVALSREHGPIGGNDKAVFVLAKPDSQAVDCGTAELNAQSNSSARTNDPVAKFMAGVSDPVEYFAGALGNAKLLGCVRLVDIIKTVLQVSGARVPRINQKEIFDGAIEMLRPVLRNLNDGPITLLRGVETKLVLPDAPEAAKAKLLPSLRSAIGSLERALAEINSTAPRADVVASLASAAYSQLRSFVNDARQLTENPIALLPRPVAEVIDKAQKAYDELDKLRDALIRVPAALRELFIDAMAAETQRLRKAIESSSEYRATVEWVDRIQGQTEALAQAIADNAWQRIGQALTSLDEPVADLRSWIGVERDKVKDALNTFVRELCGPAELKAMNVRTNLTTILAAVKRVEGGLRKLHQDAIDQKQANAANKLQDALRSTHQLREMLLTFIDMTDRAAKAKQDLLVGLTIASEYLQKFETLLCKFGETLSILPETVPQVDRAILASGGDPVNRLLDSYHVFVKDLKLSETLTNFKRDIGSQLPAKGLKKSIDTSLAEAITIAQKLEHSPADIKDELKLRKRAILAEVEKQLSLLLARFEPGGAQIVTAAQVWQERLNQIETRLYEALKVPIEACKFINRNFLNIGDVAEYGPISKELAQRLTKLGGDLETLVKSCEIADASNVLNSIRKASIVADEVLSLASFVGQAVKGGNLGELVDQRALVEKALAAIGVPTKLRISYDWKTDIDDFPRGGGAVFRPDKDHGSGPGKQPQLEIHSVTEIDLRNPTTPMTVVNGFIDPFDLHLFGTAPFLIVTLAPVRFSAGNRQNLKFDVKVNEVKFGQALNFVNDLAKFIQAESGFYLQAASGVPGIEIGYRFNKDVIQLAALTLQNVSLSLAVILPFDNSPMRLRVAVGSRQKPVLASVGIYGGGFFVGMTMRADAMEMLEASMEYGGVTGVSFGGNLATGTCKITAGVYISLGVRDEISGFFSASGALTIASIMKVGASLVVTISKSGGTLTGTAVYSFEFSIGFAEYDYSVAVSYSKDGKEDMGTDAEGHPSSESEQQTAISSSSSLFLPRDASVKKVGEQTPSDDPVDYNVDMREGSTAASNTTRTHAGLANSDVWRAYWSAFSDLDDATVEMCAS